MTKSVDEQKLATQKIVAMFNTGDLSEADTLFAAGYVDHQRPAWLDAVGAEEFKQIVLAARTSLPNLQVMIAALIAEEDTVAARLHWRSTQPSGNVVDRETIDMLHFEDGKVIEHWGAEAWAKETSQNNQTS